MDTLREIHLSFRAQDQTESGRQRRALLEGKGRECATALRHDPDCDGKCIWCGKQCADPEPEPVWPYSLNAGVVQDDETYLYYFGNDESDLPYWFHGAGRVVTEWW